VVTPTRRAKQTSTDDQPAEKTLRFRFPVMNNGSNVVAPPMLHYHFIAAVQDAFGDKVKFLDNNNRILDKIDMVRFDIKHQKHTFKWYSSASNKQRGFAQQPDNINTDDRRTTKYVSHRVRTALTMSDIKSNSRVKSLLTDHNFFVNYHRWDETEWDVIQLGFFFGLDPTFLTVDQATSKVTADLQAAIAANAKRQKMPKFKLVFGSPKITINNRAVRTKAYAIEGQRATSGELISLLKDAYKTTGSFITYQMRQRAPEALHKVIRAQTKFIANNRVILLNNIGESAIFYLEQHIMAIPGVQGLLPTKNHGQYKVSVQEPDFTRVRQHLAQNLTDWYDTHVTADAQNREGMFSGPPTVAPITSDDYSDDEQSYMTVSINAAMSLVSILSDDDDKTGTTNGANTKSSNAQPIPSSISAWPTPSGTTMETPSSATQSSVVDKKLINDLAASRAEVEALKQQVSQLVAQHESQAKQIAEAVHKQVALALETQSAPAAANPPQSVTQEQFSIFLQMQETKFDAMTSMFREMMQSQQKSSPMASHVVQQPQKTPVDPPNEHGTQAHKRTATEELEEVDEDDDERMEIDSEVPSNSRKRNDQKASPVKQKAPLFPLFRREGQDNDVSRNLFGGRPEEVSPTNVPLPLSPVRDASTSASLTEDEGAQQSTSSGNESKKSTPRGPQEGDLSTTASSC
jgi:hypothetical protein